LDELKNILRKTRKERNVSQIELATFLGVGKTTISNYETGYSTPDNDTLVRIADFFDISTDYLLGRIDKKNESYIDKKATGPDTSDVDKEYLNVIKEAKEADLSPDEIQDLIKLTKKIKSK
jgi:transcriptional regulator with XRE-family HTH domain